MEVILRVDGRELSLDEVEAIVREHFSKMEETMKQEKNKQESIKCIRGPEEGVPFKVNPTEIDRSLFQKNREDRRQKATRELIMEASAEGWFA